MVSSQKPIIKKIQQSTKPNSGNTNSPGRDLEKEITDVIATCKDIISCNNSFKKNQQHAKNDTKVVDQTLITQKGNVSEITLEKVALDLTNILKDLKDHLYSLKGKNDSFSDVAPKLEESFLESNRHNKNNSFFQKCKSKPTTPTFKGGNNTNSTAPTVKNGVKPKTGAINESINGKTKGNNISKSNAISSPTVNKSSVLPSKNNMSRPHSVGAGNTAKAKLPNNINVNNQSTKPSPSSNKGVPSKVVYDPIGTIKAEVDKAIRARKTFTVRGCFPAIRRSLLNRGWVEKLHISYRDRINSELKKFQNHSINELVYLLGQKDIAQDIRKLIKSKLLSNHQVDLYWSYNYDAFKECPEKVKLTKINKFRNNVFSYTSKLGLCNANKDAVWFKIPGVANFNHPRAYSLAKDGDTPGFIKDFYMTAAISLLKWVVQNDTTGKFKVLSPSGKIPIEVFDFAVNECYKFIKKAQHDDIDNEIKEALDHEWNEFLQYFYKTVHIGNHFRKNNQVTEQDMVRKANYILTKLSDVWPSLNMDGIMNIWILKPRNGSQGVGIHICRTLQYILSVIKANPNRRYLIQKYIERPFLIYNTKFDIRQWFLISSVVPLRIWMYKRCYLRFSSQTYNLRKLHESIHLTNNSIQCRYQKSTKDIALPSYNMWDSTQFQNYLSDIGYPNAFKTIIYPGMKQCITAAVIMYEDRLDRRRNCFELYGADFMLTEDFKPWLLEINSNPALHASTPITAKMCPKVLEDVIKVVIDYEANKQANTGDFELVYQKDLSAKTVTNKQFEVKGMPVTNDYFYTPKGDANNSCSGNQNTPIPSFLALQKNEDNADYVQRISKGMRKTLENLLVVLKQEKEKRLRRRNKGVVTTVSYITGTKESQTEYKNLIKMMSETLIASQILENSETQYRLSGFDDIQIENVISSGSDPVTLSEYQYNDSKIQNDKSYVRESDTDERIQKQKRQNVTDCNKVQTKIDENNYCTSLQHFNKDKLTLTDSTDSIDFKLSDNKLNKNVKNKTDLIEKLDYGLQPNSISGSTSAQVDQNHDVESDYKECNVFPEKIRYQVDTPDASAKTNSKKIFLNFILRKKNNK